VQQEDLNKSFTPFEADSRTGSTRREFLGQLTMAGAGFTIAPAITKKVPAEIKKLMNSPGPDNMNVSIIINGKKRTLSIEPRVTLLDALRENLKLTGTLSGMRTTAGLQPTRSLVCSSNTKKLPVSFLEKKSVSLGINLLRLGEFIGDKLPNAPDRIAKPGLVARAGVGALCGAAIYYAEGKKAATGAVIGGLAAIASTYAFFHLRKAVCKKTGIADPFIGVAEDALATAGAMALLKANFNEKQLQGFDSDEYSRG